MSIYHNFILLNVNVKNSIYLCNEIEWQAFVIFYISIIPLKTLPNNHSYKKYFGVGTYDITF